MSLWLKYFLVIAFRFLKRQWKELINFFEKKCNMNIAEGLTLGRKVIAFVMET